MKVVHRAPVAFATGVAVIVMLSIAGCSSSSPPAGSSYTVGDAAVAATPAIPSDGGAAVMPFPSGGPGDPGANKVYVTISGESNALTGYPFPPTSWTTDTYMFDGWEFVISEYIVDVDKVTLWSNPDLSATDPSQHGPAVAELDGPFVVDLHKGGAVLGQGGAPEEATPLGVLASQNEPNDSAGAAFDPTASYGFGFSTVAASYSGYNVNLDASEFADFAAMVQNGYSVLYVGTATWKGGQSMYGCSQTNAGGGPDSSIGDAGAASGPGSGVGDAGATTNADGGYDFTKMPQTMAFRLGFATPTHYVNCQNMTRPGMALPGEDYPRGIQISTSQSTIAQVTVHMDHPFWESFAENSPVHWDQIAAQFVGTVNPTATVEALGGVSFTAFTDSTGTPLPWRNCAGPNYTPPGNGQMFFNPLSVPVNPQATDPSKALRDYEDYIKYSQSTQGHLNSQGLCFIDRQYPAPPGGS